MKIGIIGAGPAGIYAAYELVKNGYTDVTIFEKGNNLSERHCPFKEKKVDHCIKCKVCSIMEGLGGSGAFSDGKFNITNDFGGNLWEKIGKEKSIVLQRYVDDINTSLLWPFTSKLFESGNSHFHKLCLQNGLNLLNADIRHLGTDNNYRLLDKIYSYLTDNENNVKFYFNTNIEFISKQNDKWRVSTRGPEFTTGEFDKLIIAVGRSGSKWMETVCKDLSIPTKSNRVDIGVRVELPYEIFSDLTDELYESKIVYKTKTYEDYVRTFCMNPKGEVVTENTNGLITVNGHSYENKALHTNNTNFALLVSQHFTEPFNDSNGYAESIIKLSNMLGGGVIVQKFGDLIRGKRTTESRLNDSSVRPTLNATPGDLSLVLPKRLLDDIIEMIYQLDKVAPGTANDDTLLYGVEAKFYNFEAEVNEHLQAKDGLYILGDGSGITHSLSQAATSGVFAARDIINKK